jgi:hypothetical protein
MIGEPANCVFASLQNFVDESAPVIEDRVEEFISVLEPCLNSFLWSGLEEVSCLRAVPAARWDWRSGGRCNGCVFRWRLDLLDWRRSKWQRQQRLHPAASTHHSVALKKDTDWHCSSVRSSRSLNCSDGFDVLHWVLQLGTFIHRLVLCVFFHIC